MHEYFTSSHDLKVVAINRDNAHLVVLVVIFYPKNGIAFFLLCSD